jgi:phage gpG-like protein
VADTVQGAAGLDEYLNDFFQEAVELDLEPAMEAEFGHLERLHETYFDNERAPDGSPWAPLAPSTIARKGHNRILIETDAMRKSLVDQSGDSIRELARASTQGLSFGTNDPKSPFHTKGTGRMPAREHIGVTEDYADQLAERTADFIVEALTK